MGTVLATRAFGKVLYRVCARCGIDLKKDARPSTRLCRDCQEVTKAKP